MIKRRRAFIFLTFLSAFASVGLLSISLGTDFWVISMPIRVVNTPNDSFIYENSYIHFGLWKGEKTLDAGFSTEGRTVGINVISRYIDTHIITYELWLSCVVLIIIAIIWGIIATVFAIINTIIYPDDKMAGSMGLYMWNGFALSFVFLSTLFYTILYFGDIRNHILSSEEIRSGFKVNGEKTYFGWSFYITFGSMICHILNIFFTFLADVKCLKKKSNNSNIEYQFNMHPAHNNHMEQTVILY